MVKSTKSPPSRKPVKARGALPAPKTPRQRGHVRWYRRPGWQLIAIVLVIAVVGTVWAAGGAWLKDRKQTRAHSEAVEQFDRRYSVLKAPVVDVLSAMSSKTQEFRSGSLAPGDFEKETGTWLSQLRKVDSELRKRTIPTDLPELEEARAVLVQGYLVYIDAVKTFELATKAAAPETKDTAIEQGTNLATHAGSIVSTGERMLERLKARFGLAERGAEGAGVVNPAEQPIQLPPEEAPGNSADAAQRGGGGSTDSVPGMTPGSGGPIEGAPGAGGAPGTEAPASP